MEKYVSEKYTLEKNICSTTHETLSAAENKTIRMARRAAEILGICPTTLDTLPGAARKYRVRSSRRHAELLPTNNEKLLCWYDGERLREEASIQ